MTLPARPRSFAERPKTALADAKTPANDNKTGVLGEWGEDGSFHFASPAAQEQWIRRAYQAGINADAWQQGEEVDDRTAELASAGLGGPMPAIYQGPDGKYRSINPKTIEPKDVRDHRSRHLAGKTMDQLAAAGKLPGEEEWIERWKVAQVRGASAQPAAVNDNQLAKQTTASTAAENGKTAAVYRPFYGRAPAPMSPAARAAATQNADDLGRIVMNSIAGNYGDEGRAALHAVGSWWNGKSFADAYAEQLPKEKSESAAAAERQGLKGTAAEIATGFIPIVGDASGLVADFKDWKENSDDWGWDDYGLVAAGVVPGIPSRRIAKKGKKVIDELLGKDGSSQHAKNHLSGNGETGASSETTGTPVIDFKAELEKARGNVLTEGEARKLDRSTRGIIYVREKASGTPESIEFMKSHPDVIWYEETQEFAVPALCFDNPNPTGRGFIKLDIASSFGDDAETVLIDAKTKMAIWSTKTQNKARDTLERLKHALLQNPGYKKVTYEFKTEKAAEAARRFIDKNNYARFVEVRVRAK